MDRGTNAFFEALTSLKKQTEEETGWDALPNDDPYCIEVKEQHQCLTDHCRGKANAAGPEIIKAYQTNSLEQPLYLRSSLIKKKKKLNVKTIL